MSEHDNEPIRGLPGYLPEGEHILWQGAPDWRVLARTALHVRWVGGYFVALAAWALASGVAGGESLGTVATGVGLTLAVGAVAVGLLTGYAWLAARSTVYTMTNKRFVLRHGVALSKCFNIPYRTIATARLKLASDGHGDIPLALADGAKIAYPHLWPHARPWRFVSPEPMMRALPDAAAVAERLSHQLQLASERPFVAEAVQPAPTRTRRPRPADGQPATA